MLAAAIVLAVGAAIAAPHLMPLRHVRPRLAAVIWLEALALRALVGIGAAIFFFLYLPRTAAYEAVSTWCLHNLVPVLGTDLGFSGHKLADTALLLPALGLTASLLWVVAGLARAMLAVAMYVRRHRRGPGPGGATVVDDPNVVVAVAGVRRPQILVSEGALAALDASELAASLAHERGHIRHHHRQLLLIGSVLAALGRSLPGTGSAERELGLSLEREADDFALRSCDPLSLASALCKAAGAVAPAPGMSLQGRGALATRLDHLLSGAPMPTTHLARRGPLAVAAGLAAIILALAATVPAWATAAPSKHPKGTPVVDCPH